MLGACLNCSICQLHEAQALVQLAVAFAEPLPELALLVPVTCSRKLPISAWGYASRQQVAMEGDLEVVLHTCAHVGRLARQDRYLMCFQHQVCSTHISHIGMPKDDISAIMAS